VRQDETEVEIAMPSVNVVVPRTGVWRPTREFAIRKLIGPSARLDVGNVDALLAQTENAAQRACTRSDNYQPSAYAWACDRFQAGIIMM
jgi:hypothetical protein